jgi:hypothetical protein
MPPRTHAHRTAYTCILLRACFQYFVMNNVRWRGRGLWTVI